MKTLILLLKTQDIGGAENVFFTIFSNLKKANFLQFIFCLESSQGEISKKAGKQGIQVFSQFKSLFVFLSAETAKGHSKEVNDILLISNGLRMLFIALCLKLKFKSVKIIFPVFWDTKKFNALNVVFLIFFLPISFFCDLVLCNSSLARNDLSRKFFWVKDRIKLLDNGIDLKNINTNNIKKSYPSNNNFNIISISRLQKRKGFEQLISKSIPEVLKKFPNAKFNIIGKDFLDGKLQNIVLEKKLSKNVHFLGFVDDIEFFYREADLFILPSLFEGVPTVLLEAMSRKVPALAFDAGGISEIYKYSETLSSELLIPDADYNKFAHAIIRILDSKVLRLSLGNDCQKNVFFNFSSIKMSDKFKELIQNA